MVVPGSSKSMSGVSQYRDFIGCLPVDLSKRILGLLEEHTLTCCKRVSQYWKHLAEETMQEIKFRRIFQDEIKIMMEGCSSIHIVSPTYANIVDVTVPVQMDEEEEESVQKVKQFEAAYAKIKTKTVLMEERNVYCGAYFSKMLLNEKDPYRVVDYKGGRLMATGSKDRLVHLFYVASETKAMTVMRGHAGSVRAVLLCEDRGLIITAGCDATIRCWNLKTDSCAMVLYGHTRTINCLDVHGDRLVSGANDYTVKVWSLQTWRQLKDIHFKHHSSVLCVKMDKTTVYSSCVQGLVKIWNMENGSLLRVIDAHKNSVKCLFFDQWHLLSGDSSGKVKAWSVSCGAKECLMTFNHPKEVKSLALIYLRVITGCVDGKIRIFNFLTGDCLRDIVVDFVSGTIRSFHFHDHSILVNTTSSVQLYQFAKVFWDHIDSTQGGCGDALAQDGLVSETSAHCLTKFPHTLSPTQKIQNCNKKPEKISITKKSQTKEKMCRKTAQELLMQSEKAASERIKKRGPHHPLTRDSILLRVGTIQRVKCMDEVSINMEHNASLRDSWGPPTPLDLLRSDAEKQILQLYPLQPTHKRRPKTCIPVLKQAAGQNMKSTSQAKEVSSAPDTTQRYHPMHPSDNTHTPNKTMS
ncbi:F-box/WD repeat-containing protein 10 isoform X2 [Melanotaenia boesemani]|nr:F-box/WD repeat-containing protein 10 isoform X2 [Melanotaenia boesemani]